MSEVDRLGDIERKDERSWRLTGDPAKVDSGPAIFPGTVVHVVPAGELHRAHDQLRGAVEDQRAMTQVRDAVERLRAGSISAMSAWQAVVDAADRRGGQ